MNKTLKSLLAKGISSDISSKIIEAGHSLKSLSVCSEDELLQYGITSDIKKQIFGNNRPEIPEKILDSLLFKSRRTCCICRDSIRSIIVHHIHEWSDTKSNNEDNLVVLCLHHHDEAHSKKELSQNLTSERIVAAKIEWEKQVLELDKKLLLASFKENEITTIKLSRLKEKWMFFLRSLNMRIEVGEGYDFKIFGKSVIYVKVFEIDSIDELVNSNKLIDNFDSHNFLDTLLILGNGPFLSNNGFYSNETNIQIGWMYNYGGDEWDNIMLKENLDISNSQFFIENLLYENTNYKNFMTEDEFDEIINIWNN